MIIRTRAIFIKGCNPGRDSYSTKLEERFWKKNSLGNEGRGRDTSQTYGEIGGGDDDDVKEADDGGEGDKDADDGDDEKLTELRVVEKHLAP